MTLILWIAGLAVWFGLLRGKLATPSLQFALTLVFVVWFPFIIVFVTPRRMWLNAQNRIAELETQLGKQLELLFVEDITHFRDFEYAPDSDEIQRYIYRIGIRNLSKAKTVKDALVILEVVHFRLWGNERVRSIYTLDAPRLPVRLCEPFDLAPDTKEYIEVVSENTGNDQQFFVGKRLIPIPCGKYEFTLLATGHDVPPTRHPFDVEKEIGGRLIFRPKTG